MATDIVFGKVMGSGEFPLDMLRYDCCAPASEEDSGVIRSINSSYQRDWVVYVKKVLHKKRRKRDVVFTEGRWNSFGCSIREVENVSRSSDRAEQPAT